MWAHIVRAWEVALKLSRKGAESGRVLQRRSVLRRRVLLVVSME